MDGFVLVTRPIGIEEIYPVEPITGVKFVLRAEQLRDPYIPVYERALPPRHGTRCTFVTGTRSGSSLLQDVSDPCPTGFHAPMVAGTRCSYGKDRAVIRTRSVEN